MMFPGKLFFHFTYVYPLSNPLSLYIIGYYHNSNYSGTVKFSQDDYDKIFEHCTHEVHW